MTGVVRKDQTVPEAVAGERVELGLIGLSDDSNISIGAVLCSVTDPVPMVRRFGAKLVTVDMRMPLVKGSQLIFHSQSTDLPCVLKKLVSLLHKSTGEVVKKRPRCLTAQCSAQVEVELDRSVPLESYNECRALGRFTLRRQGRTVAVGIISSILD